MGAIQLDGEYGGTRYSKKYCDWHPTLWQLQLNSLTFSMKRAQTEEKNKKQNQEKRKKQRYPLIKKQMGEQLGEKRWQLYPETWETVKNKWKWQRNCDAGKVTFLMWAWMTNRGRRQPQIQETLELKQELRVGSIQLREIEMRPESINPSWWRNEYYFIFVFF